MIVVKKKYKLQGNHEMIAVHLTTEMLHSFKGSIVYTYQTCHFYLPLRYCKCCTVSVIITGGVPRFSWGISLYGYCKLVRTVIKCVTNDRGLLWSDNYYCSNIMVCVCHSGYETKSDASSNVVPCYASVIEVQNT